MLSIIPAIALAATVTEGGVKKSDQMKVMKAVADKFGSIPKTGVMTFGKPQIIGNIIVAPMNMETAEVIKVEDANNYLSAFSRNACTLKLVEGMAQYDFSIRFDLSVNGAPLTTKSVNSAICAAYYLTKMGFNDNKRPAPAYVPGGMAYPSFDFKGLTAGKNLSGSDLSICENYTEIKDKYLSCSASGIDVSGLRLSGNFDFYNGRFVGMNLRVRADDQEFLVAALEAKYGTKCDVKVNEWRNKFGTKFDNVEFRWCFKSGLLIFEAMTDRIDKGRLAYYDINGPEPEKPVVNF